MNKNNLSRTGFDPIQVERLGIYTLLAQLGITLNLTFEEKIDYDQTQINFAVDWGFCHYYRLTTGEISIEDHHRQCGVIITSRSQQIRVWYNKTQEIDRQLWHGLIRYGVAAYLSDCGNTPIHAAAIIAPNGYAWMIAGQTHSGKSTLVLGLLASGWKFLSDDSLILRVESGKLIAYGWLGTSLIDPILLQTYPELQYQLGAAVGKRRLIDLKSLYSSQWIAKIEPQGLLFPTFKQNTSIANLESLSSGMALGKLMTHTATWLMEKPQQHLVHLQQLTNQCQYFNLSLGSTLRTRPDLVADILQQATIRRSQTC